MVCVALFNQTLFVGNKCGARRPPDLEMATRDRRAIEPAMITVATIRHFGRFTHGSLLAAGGSC
jgi:hypothetical protein